MAQVLTIFFALMLVYLANGDFLPGNDAVANVRLAGKLVTQRKLVFTPEEDPSMFEWKLLTATGARPVRFGDWGSIIDGQPARRHFERGALIKPGAMYYLMPTRFPGVYADRYGIGAGLYGAPFVAAVYPFARDVYARSGVAVLWHACKFGAAFAVAATAIVLFLAARIFVRPGSAVWLALAYGLGTCAWSSTSQTLWQHGPMDLFLALGSYFLLRPDRARSAPWVGLCYASAFLCRPTAAVAVLAAGGYYALKDRRALLRFVLGGVPIALLLATYNLYYFGKPLVLGQLATHASMGGSSEVVDGARAGSSALASQVFGNSLGGGLAGIFLSPARGMLVFSPILGVALWGLVSVWRDAKYQALRPIAIAGVAMCLMVARWYGWWGGWCYGYRLLVDAVVLLAFLAIPIVESIRRRRVLAAICVVCLTWSVFVQAIGAFAYDVTGWNGRMLAAVQVPGQERPTLFVDRAEANRRAAAVGGTVEVVSANVDYVRFRPRLWALRDSPIFYYLENFWQARRMKQFLQRSFLREQG
jgi:hypothetical protein